MQDLQIPLILKRKLLVKGGHVERPEIDIVSFYKYPKLTVHHDFSCPLGRRQKYSALVISLSDLTSLYTVN